MSITPYQWVNPSEMESCLREVRLRLQGILCCEKVYSPNIHPRH
jgi:hypothetical protein